MEETRRKQKEMIVCYPNPILKKHCEDVTEFGEELEMIVKLLKLSCDTLMGFGLSAPQLGIEDRIFIVNGQYAMDKPSVFINPVITDGTGESIFKEGCLSIPGVWAKVKRFNDFIITAKDVQGKEFTHHVTDCNENPYGIVLQHEMDHLNGVLFIDRLEQWEKNRVQGAINKLRKKNDPLLAPPGPKKQKKKQKKKRKN